MNEYKLNNYLTVREYLKHHSKTSEDGLGSAHNNLLKICNAAIACIRFTGIAGNLGAAFQRTIELVQKEKDWENEVM